MVKGGGNLDDALVEVAQGAPVRPPDVFQGLVALEELPGVELLDALGQGIQHRVAALGTQTTPAEPSLLLLPAHEGSLRLAWLRLARRRLIYYQPIIDQGVGGEKPLAGQRGRSNESGCNPGGRRPGAVRVPGCLDAGDRSYRCYGACRGGWA